jgi:polyisoprenoid-binding protein YceI
MPIRRIHILTEKHWRCSRAGRVSMDMRTLVPFWLFFGVWLAPAETVKYRVAPASGSNFSLDVFKTGLMSGKKHHFVFSRYSGDIEYDRDRPANSKVRFAVEAASATLTDDWVKEGDRQKILSAALHDMMAAEKYPQLIFSSTRISAKAPNRFEVEGMLTVRGIPRLVTLDVTVRPGTEDRIEIVGGGEIRLRDYGLKPPSAALGAIGTKNEMRVQFALTALKSD